MKSVTEAYEVLGKAMGGRLSPDSAGFVKLRAADAVDVFLETVSDTEFEVTIRLADGSEPPDLALMQGMLIANADPGAPRLALETGSNAILIGDRIDVLAETPESLHARLSEIVRAAAGYITDGFGALRARAPLPQDHAPMASGAEMTIWP